MFKAIVPIGVGSALALLPAAASAQQGTSSSYGTVGWGPVVPTISLTNKQRDWNHDNPPSTAGSPMEVDRQFLMGFRQPPEGRGRAATGRRAGAVAAPYPPPSCPASVRPGVRS